MKAVIALLAVSLVLLLSVPARAVVDDLQASGVDEYWDGNIPGFEDYLLQKPNSHDGEITVTEEVEED